MNHEEFESRLDDYVDGTLPSADRAELEVHLAACTDCTATVVRLRALLEAARQLPTSVAPGRDLWPGLRERLAADEIPVLPDAPPEDAARRGHRRPWHPALRWAAAAVVILLAASVWLTQRADRRPPSTDVVRGPQPHVVVPPPFATSVSGVLPAVVAAFERECMGAGKTLQASVEGRGNPADEAMLQTVAAGIEVLDQSIAETRAALESNADDVALMKLLTVRYQQKLALLQGAIAIVEEV